MNIQTLLANILVFLNGTIVPFILAIAFLVFLWNAAQYFIIGGSNEESQSKAKSLALWGISAFVVIISFWGIVNLLVNSLGFSRSMGITPDYMDSKDGYVSPDDWGPGANLSNKTQTTQEVFTDDWNTGSGEPTYVDP